MNFLAVIVLSIVAAYFFFKHIRSGAPRNSEFFAASASSEDWVQPFVLYYIASEMRFVGEDDIPDTLRSLASGRETVATRQSILIALQNYLSFAYGRDRKSDDCAIAIQAGRNFLQAELNTPNSRLAVKRFVRRMHEKDRHSISEDELEASVTKLTENVKANTEFSSKLHGMLLRDSVEEMFEARHTKTIDAYDCDLRAYQEARMAGEP